MDVKDLRELEAGKRELLFRRGIFLLRHDGVAREVVGQHHRHVQPPFRDSFFKNLQAIGREPQLAPLTPQK